ncbi:MFS transporter [Haladaptatus sp. DJG-WS-42]|uniref:MFS transporter n=1 Tax=Haladaptatus sp. DJG-WS-42 TaxID=3120516 RepID=UPI0030CC2384
MTRDSLQFSALYLTRFAAGFGLVTLLTLLSEYIDLLNPSGFVLGMFVTSLTLAQAVAVLPLAYGGDRYDKRRILLASLLISIAAYVGFALVSSTGGFLLARGLQGLAITGTSLMALSLVGELAPDTERANYIGKANAWRFAAGILGTLSAGVLYEQYGFEVVFAVIVALLVPATLGVWLFLEPDETTGGDGFALTDLALNRRILTLTSFRAQYAVAVTLVRT